MRGTRVRDIWGPDGSHVLALRRELQMPIVTTLHTILREPSEEQGRVMRGLIRRSTRLVVMSERGREFRRDICQAPESKIDLIPHGIPDMLFADPNYFKDEFGVAGNQVLLTFGLLPPNKGMEYALRALPDKAYDTFGNAGRARALKASCRTHRPDSGCPLFE